MRTFFIWVFNFICAFIIAELALRMYHVLFELYRSIYNGTYESWNNFMTAQWRKHKLNNILLFIVLALFMYFITKFTNDNIIIPEGGFSFIIAFSFVYCLQKEFRIFESDRDIINFIQAGCGLDYGSGMAHSFFYGYLNKILPHMGDENIGIKENIEIYEASNGVYLPAKKLFILIPLSMHFSPSLVEHAPEGVMEACNPLKTIYRDVAGVISRPYQNSVYKIHLDKMGYGKQKPLYVVAEGATPLHTLYQTCTGRIPACSESIRDHSQDIVNQFYKTLSRILESFHEYRGTYELITYQGEENVAELLVQRIMRM